MKRFLSAVFLLACFTFPALPAHAEEKSQDGFFGIKKFLKKDASPKKEKAKDDGELTEEEKKIVKAATDKTQGSNKGANGKGIPPLPAHVLSADAPAKIPTAPKPVITAPKSPNSVIITLPKLPGRPPMAPVTSGPEKAPTAPSSKNP